MKKKIHTLFLCFFVLVGCQGKPKLNLVEPPPDRTLESFQTQAEHAMVVTPNPQATQVGLDILKEGGNAADSAIAVSFALSVLRPQSTGLGGGGFLVFYDKAKDKTIAVDFREKAPLKATHDMYIHGGKADPKLAQDGALAVAVPRLVTGLGYIYEHYASHKIPWAELVRPAIELALKGFQIYPHLAKALEERKGVLKRFESSRRIFLPKNKPLQEGDILIQKDLGRTLTIIAMYGWRAFYEGEIALNIIRASRQEGGILTLEDFQNVFPTELKTVEGTYHGYKIVSMPPPSSGGVILIEILNILEEFPLRRWGPYHFETVHVATEAMKLGFKDRASYLGDPRFVKVPVRGLISKDYSKGLATSINLEKVNPLSPLPPPPFSGESNSTTHFSIVDSQGDAVAATETINYLFGSGVVAFGTGIVLNDEMDDFSIEPGVANIFGLVGGEANAIAPGKIPLSSMSPTFVFDRKGRLQFILGSPGGPKIISAILNTLLNLIDFKAPPLEAVAAKRYHHQWLPDKLEIEPGLFPPPLTQRLLSMGHKIEENNSSWLIQLIAKTKGEWVGVSDPRGVGMALGY